MTDDLLTLSIPDDCPADTLIVALRGWMDAGEVSSGTAQWVIDESGAREIGRIDGEPFLIRSFPGSIEIAAMFRPRIRVEKGRIDTIEEASNLFYYSREHRLGLFLADEPHLNWRLFRKAFFEAAVRLGVGQVLFLGAIGGPMPHTREPRIFTAASSSAMLETLTAMGMIPVDYAGPSSFASYCLSHAREAGIEAGMMAVEVPAYIQGRNPRGMLAALRIISTLTGFAEGLEGLRKACDHWEKRVSEAADEHPELADQIRQLEEDFDHDLFNTQMADLKDWLEEKGLRVD